MTGRINVYLEAGVRRTFAAALDWPGWCRMGRDEATALASLLEYGPRYARILSRTRLGLRTAQELSEFVVVERLKGNATTDFGAPDVAPPTDKSPLDDVELRRLETILKACWRAFDSTVENAQGRELRAGPRGGGRALDRIAGHVLGAEASYLSALGGKASEADSAESVRRAILKTLEASAHGEIAGYGPRGGKRWLPRYFVRREAWHVLDHVWEIEDRLMESAA